MENLAKLGIDWVSMAAYLVNFGLLFFLVGKYLVPKIFSFLDARREIIKNSMEEANRLKDEFQSKLESLSKEKEEALSRLNVEIENLTKAVEQKKAEMMAEVTDHRNKLLADADREIAERKAMLLKEAEARVLGMMRSVVLHVLHNKVPAEVVEESVNEAWSNYQVK